jgi:hypothetical protein
MAGIESKRSVFTGSGLLQLIVMQAVRLILTGGFAGIAAACVELQR